MLDDGGQTNVGVATTFHCTNFSGVVENLRIVIRDAQGTLKTNNLLGLNHLNTLSISTHNTLLYNEVGLNTGAVTQGTAAIAATTTNIICTAVTVEAASSSPIGLALRGIRFSPAPGSQE